MSSTVTDTANVSARATVAVNATTSTPVKPLRSYGIVVGTPDPTIVVGVAAPVVIYFALGDRSGPILDRLKQWMAAHNAVIMAVLCLVIGAKLIGDGIAGLS